MLNTEGIHQKSPPAWFDAATDEAFMPAGRRFLKRNGLAAIPQKG
ncbi:hypothetical protein [Chlorobium sp.]|nr:hypothetical protein [Chlorobium sp.]